MATFLPSILVTIYFCCFWYDSSRFWSSLFFHLVDIPIQSHRVDCRFLFFLVPMAVIVITFVCKKRARKEQDTIQQLEEEIDRPIDEVKYTNIEVE